MLVVYLLLTCVNRVIGAQLLPNHKKANTHVTLLFTLDCHGANLAKWLHCRLKKRSDSREASLYLYVQLWGVPDLMLIVKERTPSFAWISAVQEPLSDFGLDWFLFFGGVVGGKQRVLQLLWKIFGSVSLWCALAYRVFLSSVNYSSTFHRLKKLKNKKEYGLYFNMPVV